MLEDNENNILHATTDFLPMATPHYGKWEPHTLATLWFSYIAVNVFLLTLLAMYVHYNVCLSAFYAFQVFSLVPFGLSF